MHSLYISSLNSQHFISLTSRRFLSLNSQYFILLTSRRFLLLYSQHLNHLPVFVLFYSPVDILHCLKGVCHEIFDIHFFHDSNPSRPLINRLKYFRIRFRFRRDIRSQSSKKSTPRCASHHGVKILVLAIPKIFFKSFLT